MKQQKKLSKKKIQEDFVTLTSHQLRTPLSGIKWLIELLQKSDNGSFSKKQKEYLERINFSNERMIALVNDLLEVSRIEEGQQKLYLQPTDLVMVIRSLIKDKERLVAQKKLQISFVTEQEPFPLVITELNKIKQAVGNLLSNAIIYTNPGGKIAIDLTIKDKQVLCKISDTGVGIPKDEHRHVFGKFFRGTNVLSMESTGTGLGLYITRSFIEASGGKIWFDSQVGEGTTFYFTLPIAK
jgi:signal transduction histidine kinase